MSARWVSTSARVAILGVAVASSVSLLLPLTLFERECAAATKDECVDAHGRGQDLREKGQLTRARQAFMSCAQSTCPSLIQGDCARFGDELDRIVPSVSFGARDIHATDLPVTSVYVDDVLVATRLDDGKSYDFDPGKHSVRFVHDGKETTLKVVLNQGERGRVLVATFVDPKPVGSSSSVTGASYVDRPAVLQPPKRSGLPLVVAGIGAAALAGGATILAIELGKVPSSCSMSTRECAAAPGDQAFNDAHSAMSLANVGLGIGISGAVLLVTGIIWYVMQPATPAPSDSAAQRAAVPWIGRGSSGLSVSF